jgi:hypothetical protein
LQLCIVVPFDDKSRDEGNRLHYSCRDMFLHVWHDGEFLHITLSTSSNARCVLDLSRLIGLRMSRETTNEVPWIYRVTLSCHIGRTRREAG